MTGTKRTRMVSPGAVFFPFFPPQGTLQRNYNLSFDSYLILFCTLHSLYFLRTGRNKTNLKTRPACQTLFALFAGWRKESTSRLGVSPSCIWRTCGVGRPRLLRKLHRHQFSRFSFSQKVTEIFFARVLWSRPPGSAPTLGRHNGLRPATRAKSNDCRAGHTPGDHTIPPGLRNIAALFRADSGLYG